MGVERGSFHRTDFQPFREPIEELIDRGKRFDVYAVGDTGWVVKDFKSTKDIEHKEKLLIQTSRLLRQYLGEYIPPTYLVRGENITGQARLLQVQKLINGTELKHVSWEVIRENPQIITQLVNIMKGALIMFEETRLVPDICRFNIWKEGFYNVKATRNIIIDTDNKVWLVDSELTGRFHSRQDRTGRSRIKRRVIAVYNFYQQLQRLSLQKLAT